ncbi:hypothetical protein predicted by Glimmer/Critica (plasmid) [Acetobacter ghanensis]|uniref:Uncharacterized protein n=1 Tax=Acetobacter ghanensis TaxID=431306 RepID=A0A0U5F6B3_9PROT|nr:hypothetical protein predicted by Glimmer/Critica [Acetobacter ghanensis]
MKEKDNNAHTDRHHSILERCTLEHARRCAGKRATGSPDLGVDCSVRQGLERA